MEYEDYITCAGRLAKKLRAEGADAVIALTHMRQANDVLLAAAAPFLDLILGGHDHEYRPLAYVEPHNVPYVKSGTDFREYTVVRISPRESPSARVKINSAVREDVTSKIGPDPKLAAIVEDVMKQVSEGLDQVSLDVLVPSLCDFLITSH